MYPWLAKLYTQLTQRAAQRQLHHGLLLQGVKGLGKASLAKALADFLLCDKPVNGQPCGECKGCRLIAAQSHPDIIEVRREKSQISVDQIRDAIQQLSQTAQMSGNKVLILYEAETLNQASSNALLKTLEEPTSNTYMMLVTDQPHRLLPTILSRCEKIAVKSPDADLANEWLSKQGQFDNVSEVLRLCSNAPLAALSLLQQDEGVSYAEFEQQLQALQQQSISAVSLADSWQKQAQQIVSWLQFWLAQHMPQCSPDQQQQLWQLHQQLIQASQQLDNPGINKVLVLANTLQRVRTFN